ncbi:MAG: 5-deoxy-glucuronate isomerase [Rectinemataceae bacterium]
MLLRHAAPFAHGYETVVDRGGPNSDMLMDFGILRLDAGESWSAGERDEKALLLVSGSAELTWAGVRADVKRGSLLDESPTVLHLPQGQDLQVRTGSGGVELAVMRTANSRSFAAHLYLPAECGSEERGKGTMRETSTRIVRTVFDDSNAPSANLVLGEVVAAPGKWSSYPPHHHPQPEIYHYRFVPEQGFGLAAIGDEGTLIRNRDTVLIREGQIHPHSAAPGYSMWYIWVIRHLEGRRYVNPIFVPEHEWVTGADADIWVLPSERKKGKRP